MEKFGEREDIVLCRVEGVLTREEILELGDNIAALIGMEVVGKPRVDSFPTAEGKGGAGYQVYWCWTESFLVISTWPKLGFIRVYLASCKSFLPTVVINFLKSAVGPVLQFEYVGI